MGTIQHHTARIHNGIFSVEEKMCFSGSDVKQLIVYSSFWPLCWQKGLFDKAVGAATAYNQRACSILEVYSGIIQIAGINVHICTSSFADSIMPFKNFSVKDKIKNCIVLCIYQTALFMSVIFLYIYN